MLLNFNSKSDIAEEIKFGYQSRRKFQNKNIHVRQNQSAVHSHIIAKLEKNRDKEYFRAATKGGQIIVKGTTNKTDS